MQAFLVMTLTSCTILLLDFIVCNFLKLFFGEEFYNVFWG